MVDVSKDKRADRVFVLGAGASLHAGYPLTKELGPRPFDWVEGSSPPQNIPYWPERAELAGFGELDDIEGVVTKLEATKNSGAILAGLREALCRFFQYIQPAEAKLYKEFAEEVTRPGDVLITFNYDISLELELKRAGKWEVSNGYGFDLGVANIATSPTRLLKLHGSINWMDLLFDGLQSGQFSWGIGDSRGERPVFPWGLDHLGYSGVKDPKWKQGGVDRAGSMILPSRHKQYYIDTSLGREREDFWRSLWVQAVNALRQAQEIVIIGYSCPMADAEAQNLLLKQSNRNCSLTICCGSQTLSLSEEFVKKGFDRNHIQADWGRFEDFLGA